MHAHAEFRVRAKDVGENTNTCAEMHEDAPHEQWCRLAALLSLSILIHNVMLTYRENAY